MVKIDIDCSEGYGYKEYDNAQRGVLAYYFKGPADVSNSKGEIGRYDVKGPWSGKFKIAEGSTTTFGVVKKAEDAKITIGMPDGTKIYIGSVPDPKIITQRRIILGMGCNHAVQYLLNHDSDANLDESAFQDRVLAYADSFLAKYLEKFDLGE